MKAIKIADIFSAICAQKCVNSVNNRENTFIYTKLERRAFPTVAVFIAILHTIFFTEVTFFLVLREILI